MDYNKVGATFAITKGSLTTLTLKVGRHVSTFTDISTWVQDAHWPIDN